MRADRVLDSMLRTEEDQNWSLFDPADVPSLSSTYGDGFAAEYKEYEQSGTAVAVVSARDLWGAICRAQEESGVPFIMYQDAINGV